MAFLAIAKYQGRSQLITEEQHPKALATLNLSESHPSKPIIDDPSKPTLIHRNLDIPSWTGESHTKPWSKQFYFSSPTNRILHLVLFFKLLHSSIFLGKFEKSESITSSWSLRSLHPDHLGVFKKHTCHRAHVNPNGSRSSLVTWVPGRRVAGLWIRMHSQIDCGRTQIVARHP